MSGELASLLSAGNTQPGGFYNNSALGSTFHEPQRAAAPAAPTEWKLTNDMMNQPWGSVLRQLDPSVANQWNQRSAPSNNKLMSPQMGMPRRATPLVPAMGAGRAYTHSSTGARLAPPPGVPQPYSSLGGLTTRALRPDADLYNRARPVAS